jgi:hypothetical protein
MAAPPLASFKQTYGAVAAGLVAVASATDIFTITGSATRLVYPLSIRVSGVAAAVAYCDMYAIKRSTANSGGTSTSPTRVAFSSSNIAVSATVLAYTGNPAGLGTLVGALDLRRVPLLTAAGVQFNQEVVFNFNPGSPQSPVVLNGTGDVLALNLNGATSGGTFDIAIVWAEV